MKEAKPMKNDLLKGLTEEQIAKARECKSEEELLELARKEGVKLTDEQLESISGGCGQKPKERVCPGCHSTNVQSRTEYRQSHDVEICCCLDCGMEW